MIGDGSMAFDGIDVPFQLIHYKAFGVLFVSLSFHNDRLSRASGVFTQAIRRQLNARLRHSLGFVSSASLQILSRFNQPGNTRF
jgi:hypothetical protein